MLLSASDLIVHAPVVEMSSCDSGTANGREVLLKPLGGIRQFP